MDKEKDGKQEGAAYIFSQQDGYWQQSTKLSFKKNNRISEFKKIGSAVSINGNIIAVGAYETTTTTPNGGSFIKGGSIVLFLKEGNQWNQKWILSQPNANSKMGENVFLLPDYLVYAIAEPNRRQTSGIHLDESANDLIEPSGGWWNERHAIRTTPSTTDGLAGDGKYVAAGAPEKDDKGVVLIYKRKNDYELEYKVTLKAEDEKNGQQFGNALAMKGDTLVVGS